MRSLTWKIAAVVVLSGGLAACGNNTSTAPPAPTVPPVTTAPKVEDAFGTNFGGLFRADANSVARDPVAADIAPLDLTKAPTTI